MAKVANIVLMVGALYITYRIGRSDGRKESDDIWMGIYKEKKNGSMR